MEMREEMPGLKLSQYKVRYACHSVCLGWSVGGSMMSVAKSHGLFLLNQWHDRSGSLRCGRRPPKIRSIRPRQLVSGDRTEGGNRRRTGVCHRRHASWCRNRETCVTGGGFHRCMGTVNVLTVECSFSAGFLGR